MREDGILTQLLYLAVYSCSLINAVSTLVFRKKVDTKIRFSLVLLFSSVAFSSILMSVQVFLNVSGVMDRIPEHTSTRLILVLNMLIFFMIALIIYSATGLSFAFRPGVYSKLIMKITAVISAVALLPLLLLQISMMFSYSVIASEVLGYLMIAGTALFFIGTVFSAVRMFVPFRSTEDPGGRRVLRGLFASLVILPFLIMLSGSTVGTIAAPVGFIILNILCISVLYTGIKLQVTHTGTEASAAPDPLKACMELGLSRRETDVAVRLASGMSYKEIGAELFISMSTTQTHVGRIYSKLGINNKTELANLLYYKK